MILSVARKFPHLSLGQLGMLFERDHTTIIHALRRAKQAEAIAASREPCETVIDFNELRAVAADHRSFGGLP
jgi:chromosomal replication initiation ATPase DnaA